MWPYKSTCDVPLVTDSEYIYMCGFVGLAQFFVMAKISFLAFLNQKGVWPYRHAHDIPLVTLILNIYGFMGLISSIQA